MFPPPNWHFYQMHRAEVGKAMDERCHTLDWLDVQILNDQARIFGSESAVIVVTVKQYPAGATELHGLVAAGELDGILPLIDDAEYWAREAGVTFACIASRQGWERVLKTRGYTLYQQHLRKDL